ncbi:SDR family oxidoreductase [Endozoicomonadaceae bacterium StTr2]
MNLKGKTILLTGASGGIGSAIARQLAAEGASLLLTGRREQPLQQLVNTLYGDGHHYVVADLGDPVQRQRLIDAAEDVDVLINNAGISDFRLLADSSEQDIQRMLATNVEVPISLCHSLLPLLQQKNEAAIVNVGSAFGAIGYPGYSLYCSSKFAIRGFTESLRRELADTQVQVHYLAPRATSTEINTSAVNELNRELGTATDSPERVAAELVDLLQRPSSSSRAIGWPEKFFARLNGLAPGLVDGALKKQLPTIRRYARLNHQN